MPQDFNPRAVPGNNQPPLSELLPDETAALLARATNLATAAGKASVNDSDTEGQAIELVNMMREHRKLIDETRTNRKQPFLDAGRLVDSHFKTIDQILAEVDGKGKVVGGPMASVAKMVTDYRAEQERLRQEEARRLEAEARRQREAAEAAERERLAAEQRAREAEAKLAEERAAAERERAEAARRAEEAAAAAAAAGDKAAAEKARAEQEKAEAERRAIEAQAQAESNRVAREKAEADLEAEIAANRAREEADRLEREAAALAAPKVSRSAYGGSASDKKEWFGEITDLRPLLSHLTKTNEAGLREVIQPLVDRQVRAGIREMPGVKINFRTKTAFR
jgi:hypothetical protein